MSRYTIPDLISEIRRQSGMRNATRPCLLIRDLLPLCDALETAEQQRDELQSRLNSAEFWQGIYPEGWTAERVENEMTDFLALMDGIPSLYMHITGGRVSKELTDKSVIKSLHDDYVTDLVEEATKELAQQRDELLAATEGLLLAHRITFRKPPTTTMQAESELQQIRDAVAAAETAITNAKADRDD